MLSQRPPGSARITLGLLLLVVGATLCRLVVAAESVSLAGPWRFQLDPTDAGVGAKWHDTRLPDRINLPGSLQEQGFGDDVTLETRWVGTTGVRRTNYPDWFTHPMYAKYRQPGQIRFPYWLQPKKHYVGTAWYQRDVEIPASWQGKRLTLTLERCHWESRLWVDDKPLGLRDSLAVSHQYDASDALTPGAHRITLRVDNRLKVPIGENAHSVSDHTQTAWNGIVGQIALEARDPVWIEDVQVYADLAPKKARVQVTLRNRTAAEVEGQVTLAAACEAYGHRAGSLATRASIPAGGQRLLNIDYPLGKGVRLWDEFQPALYQLQVQLAAKSGSTRYQDQQSLRFGVRQFKAAGRRLAINDRPVFLRGTLECCVFPLTGYPPTDEASWKRIMAIAKSYGLNHLRFHSWCPPEAAFAAADELGMYLQPEVDLWATVKNKPGLEQFLTAESARILRRYGNHPSFVMMALGNESYVTHDVMTSLLNTWRKDDRRVYSGPANAPSSIVPEYDFCVARAVNNQMVRYQSGWPPKPENTWFVSRPPQTTVDFREGVLAYDKPLLSHETVQRCSFPDVDQSRKYTGSLRAAYLDIARDQLQANGLLGQVGDFVRASGRWQVQLFKEEIEAALRTPSMGGFQLLDLHDFPGQGAALVGVLDAFWDSKGYVAPEEFRRFCGPTAPLARLEKRVFTSSEKLVARIEAAHFAPLPLKNVSPRCRVVDASGKMWAEYGLMVKSLPVGGPTTLGFIELELAALPAPAKYKLIVEIHEVSTANDWEFWVYPDAVSADGGDVVIASQLDASAQAALERGGKVLLLPRREALAGGLPQCFTPIYWNAPYTDGGESQTLGLLCDPAHPALRGFPTDFHSNWQWYELLANASPMLLGAWPKSARPLVQLIDDWNQNRRLGVLAEARLGKGRVMVCSMDIDSNLATRPVARQLRASLLGYMNGPTFDPRVAITEEQLRSIFRP